MKSGSPKFCSSLMGRISRLFCYGIRFCRGSRVFNDHEQCVIGAGADHPNLDAVLSAPLRRNVRGWWSLEQALLSQAVEDVDVVLDSEVANGTLMVDLECVYKYRGNLGNRNGRSVK